jgi:transposase
MRTQKSPAAFGFDRYDKGRLQNALNHVRDKRTYVRIQALLLIADGEDIIAVAKLFNCSVQIIYRWIQLYMQSHHPKDLFDVPRSGRPHSAPAITTELILQEIKQNPLPLGYHTTTWTVALLAAHLKTKYGCQIAARTLRRRMKQAGLRFKRPRYVYSEKDPHRAQKKGR